MTRVPPRRGARFSIRQKFLFALAASAVALAVVGLLTVAYSSRELRSDARHQLTAVADLEQARLDQQLWSMSDKLEPLTRTTGVGGAVRAFVADHSGARRAALRTALQEAPEMPMLEAISVYTVGGRLLATSAGPGGTRVPAAPPGAAVRVVRASITGGQPWTAGLAFPSPSGGSYVHALQVRERGRAIAVIVAECRISGIAEIAGTHSQLGDTADAHIVQEAPGGAQFITAPRFTPDARWNLIVPRARASAPAVQALGLTEPRLIEGVRDYRDVPVLAALRPLARTPWVLIVKVDEAEAFAVSRRIAVSILVAFLAVIGILGLAILVVSRSVIGRIRRVTESATAISRGDLKARLGDPSRDELGALALAFDRMADTLSQDIGRRTRMEAQLEHQAGHDALTGLPNRARFQERLELAMDIADQRVAVLFCDLDEFKSVNDELGHAAGDQLLTVVAHRFRSVLRPADLLARFGGDEFVVICVGIADQAEAETVAQRLQGSLGDPVAIGASEAYVSVSIGISLDGPGATPESMVRDADAAMYRAKELGRRRHVTHDEDIRERASARLTAATDLRRAVEQGRLALVFQPIVDLRTLRVTAMESLVRWPRNGTWTAPADFVPRAQELGLGGALDRWVVRRATRQLAEWRAQDGAWDDLAVSVNISPMSLAEPGLPEEVLDAVAAAGIGARDLIVEVTEEALSLAGQPAVDALARLRAEGVRIAIDDFGTGHSSLARLRDLPVDIMKLDRQMVEHVDHDRQARDITMAVLQLAATMDVLVVAEGVERLSQREVLLALGCDCGQGFHFAPPEPSPPAPAGLLGAR